MNAAAIARRVDRLGEIKKQINDLEKKMLEIREELLEAGVEEAQGRVYEVVFKEVDTTRVDWKAIQRDYELPIEKYSLISSCVRMMVSPL
jgi:predicted phage-related endonuclease